MCVMLYCDLWKSIILSVCSFYMLAIVLSHLCWKFCFIHVFILSAGILQTNRLSRNNLIGYCEIDLVEVLSRVTFFFFRFIFNFLQSTQDIVGLWLTLHLFLLPHDFFLMHKLFVCISRLSIVSYLQNPSLHTYLYLYGISHN